MGKYSQFKDKLVRFESDDSDFVAKVHQAKLLFLESATADHEFGSMLMDAKNLKATHEHAVSQLNVNIEALERILADSFENNGLTSMKTAAGSFFIEDKPMVTITDKAAFNKWIHDTGQQDLLQVLYQTAAAITKEKLLNGELLPPGTEVRMKVGIGTRKPKE